MKTHRDEVICAALHSISIYECLFVSSFRVKYVLFLLDNTLHLNSMFHEERFKHNRPAVKAEVGLHSGDVRRSRIHKQALVC